MAVFWVLLGAVGAWAIMWFRATKARVVQQANLEFAALIHAMDAWNENPADPDNLDRALYHFAVYDARRLDAASPTRIPADRAALAGYWVKALQDTRLLDAQGNRTMWNEGSADFWGSIDRMREERDKARLRGRFEV